MGDQEQVPFRATRKSQFTPEQRWALPLEYDKGLDYGSKAAFCRRVSIGTWTMRDWVRKRAAGEITDPALTPQPPQVSRARMNQSERAELERLRAENQRLERELHQAQTAAEILGKAAAFLEGLAKNAQEPVSPPPIPSQPGTPWWLADPDTSSLPQIPSRNCTPRPK